MVALAVTVSMPTTIDAASSPSPRTNDRSRAAASTLPPAPADPYAAFLDKVAAESEPCKKHVAALQALLKKREELVLPAQHAGPEQKKQVSPQLDELDQQISAEETALNDCEAKRAPAEPPPTPPTVPVARDGTPIPIEKLKEDYYPPVPPTPAAPAVPPAPAREAAYVDVLAAHAAGSPVLSALVEDLRNLMEERREAAVRYLNAEEGLRPFIAAQIFALSQRIQETADGIQEGPTTSQPTQTAGL